MDPIKSETFQTASEILIGVLGLLFAMSTWMLARIEVLNKRHNDHEKRDELQDRAISAITDEDYFDSAALKTPPPMKKIRKLMATKVAH